MKEKIVEYLGGKCIICGYIKCNSALVAHHKNPKTKSFALSIGSSKSWETIKMELDKCVLLCQNCHSEAHAGVYDFETLLCLGATSI